MTSNFTKQILDVEKTLAGLRDCYGSTSSVSLYGCAELAARHCDLRDGRLQFPGFWQHGWASPHRTLSPEYQFGECEISPQMKLWVARKDQEIYLRENGFEKTRAIGLPAVYVPRSSTKRIPNSLLVVPAHSLEYTTHAWKFDEYADQINAVKRDFDSVAALVHQSCIEKGYWVHQFKRLGVKVFPGALGADPSSLYRLELLFSTFDCVTSNAAGSHIAYASLWGAKVSLFGTYAELRAEDYRNTPFYQQFPHLLEPAIEGLSEETTRNHFPEFFVEHPNLAIPRVGWGEFQVGAENRLSPNQMRKAFGWTISNRTIARAYKMAVPIAEEWLPEVIKRPLVKRIYPQLAFQRDLEQEISRLSLLPADHEGSTSILGPKLTFPSAPDCTRQLWSTFGTEIYKFNTLKQKPFIIDVGAGIGIASIYFAQNFRDAKILAFEADIKRCDCLRKNLLSFKIENVQVHEANFRTANGRNKFASDSLGTDNLVNNGAYITQTSSGCLRDLLVEHVDMLKLDVEGSEVDWLLECADLLQNVDRLFVEYYSSFSNPQRLQELINVLVESGFRIHFHSPLPAVQPFIHRPINRGCDLLLGIFGFRV